MGPTKMDTDKTPTTPAPYDPDKDLTETDFQNLYKMGFPRPSRVLDEARQNGLQYAMDILEIVETMNRSIGQKLGIGSKMSQEKKR